MRLYELQEANAYRFRAEYSSERQLHTLIQGKLWKKTLDFDA